MQEYRKSLERATESINLKNSEKALYRRAQAYAAIKDYWKAVADLKAAIKLNPEKLVFCSKGKAEQAQTKTFKRFCKVLATNLIDIYPKNKGILPALLREILNFSIK